MPDTFRTRSQALSLIADNTSGDISPQDLRDNIISAWGLYAALSVNDNTNILTLNTSLSKLVLFALSEGSATTGVSPDIAQSEIEVNHDGVYLVFMHLTATQMNPTTEYTFVIQKNGTAVTGTKAEVVVSDAGDFENISVLYPVNCVDGDIISIGGESDDPSGQNVTITQAQLTAWRIF